MIPDSLNQTAHTMWGRKSLTLIIVVGEAHLVELHPPFRATLAGHGDRFVLALPRSEAPSGWQGWCCNQDFLSHGLNHDYRLTPELMGTVSAVLDLLT